MSALTKLKKYGTKRYVKKLGLFLSYISSSRPGATAGHSGAVPPPNDCLCPPNENCSPPSKDCAPKKLPVSVLRECKSRPETPNILVIALEFVSKNCCFAVFMHSPKNSREFACILGRRPFFSFGLHLRIREKSHDF